MTKTTRGPSAAPASAPQRVKTIISRKRRAMVQTPNQQVSARPRAAGSVNVFRSIMPGGWEVGRSVEAFRGAVHSRQRAGTGQGTSNGLGRSHPVTRQTRIETREGQHNSHSGRGTARSWAEPDFFGSRPRTAVVAQTFQSAVSRVFQPAWPYRRFRREFGCSRSADWKVGETADRKV